MAEQADQSAKISKSIYVLSCFIHSDFFIHFSVNVHKWMVKYLYRQLQGGAYHGSKLSIEYNGCAVNDCGTGESLA